MIIQYEFLVSEIYFIYNIDYLDKIVFKKLTKFLNLGI